jgi:hypothetical protein
MNTRRLAGALFALALTGSLLTACGGEEQSAVCDDVDDLRVSLTSLQAFDIYDPNVLSDLSAVLDQVRSQVQTLAEDASSEYDAEVAVVESSIDDLETSAQAAVAEPGQAALATLEDDVKGFSAAFKDLRAAVGDTC